jgi:hypothetical protein
MRHRYNLMTARLVPGVFAARATIGARADPRKQIPLNTFTWYELRNLVRCPFEEFASESVVGGRIGGHCPFPSLGKLNEVRERIFQLVNHFRTPGFGRQPISYLCKQRREHLHVGSGSTERTLFCQFESSVSVQIPSSLSQQLKTRAATRALQLSTTFGT